MKKSEGLGPFSSERFSASLIKQFQSEITSSHKTVNGDSSFYFMYFLGLECYSKFYVTVNRAYIAKTRYYYDNK